MKVSHVIIASVLVGAVAGAAMSFAEFGNPPPMVFSLSKQDKLAPGQAGRPKLLVDQRAFDFGAVDRDTKASHAFRFTNVGDAPLELKPGSTTCSRCTIAQVSKTTLMPGESSDVTVDYLPSIGKRHFRQRVTVHTNDPQEQTVELHIFGHVTGRYMLAPDDFAFNNISVNETKTVQVKLYAFHANSVRVVKHEFVNSETASHFEAKSEPIPQDQLMEPDARSGCLISLTVKPGLPLGTFDQTIRLEVEMEGVVENPTVDVPVYGKVDSDISIVGATWKKEVVRIGAVKGAQGATRNLFIVLRGRQRHDVKLTVASTDPSWLRVTIGEPIELKPDGPVDSGVTQVPLTVEIPPGSPPANHLGYDQGKYAQIVLDTTHPQVKQIRIPLQFVVEQ
jgi:hypothetical protein